MAVWPFGRSGGRKRPRSGATLSDHDAPGVVETGHSSGLTSAWAQTPLPPSDALDRPSQKKRRTTASHPQTGKLHRRTPAKSFPPSRRNSTRMAPDPRVHRARGTGTGSPQLGDDAMGVDDELQRAPTLYGHRTFVSQRAKARSNTQAQLEGGCGARTEPTANNPLLHRSANDLHRSNRPKKRGSKRSRSAFGLGKSWGISDISLPTPESIHSSLSSESEAGFKVSALDSLAPRPTLQYAYPVHYCAPSRRPSQRKDFGMTEEVLRARKRIDDLADGFDASDLRELMDRDKRRRERKSQQDREEMEARLATRAAAQAEDERLAQQAGAPSPINLERGVIGRELHGRDSPSTVWVVQRRESDVSIDPTPQPSLVTEKEEMRRSIEEQLSQHPAEHLSPQYTTRSIERVGSERDNRKQKPDTELSLSARTPNPISQDRSIDGALPVERQQQMPTPPRSPNPQDALDRKKSVSRSSLVSEAGKFTVVKIPRPQEQAAPVDPEEPQWKKSHRLSLSTFFKWPGKSKVATPASSFSNTSREEMLAAAAHLRVQPGHQSGSQETIVPVRRVASNVPKRTRSRFREDLPELPMSPSSPQLPSSEANAEIHHVNGSTPPAENRLHDPLSAQPTPRSNTPSSEHHTLETMRNTPISWGPGAHTPVPMSLDSVDSEGSWFAGKVINGRKSPMSRTVSRTTHHQSVSHSHTSLSDSFDDPIPDDEYMAQLSPVPNHGATNGGSVGEARPSSDEDEDARTEVGDAKWGSVDAGRARVVSAHELKAIRSREGLLHSYAAPEQQAELADTDGESDAHTSILSSDSNGLQRARSVQFGKGYVKHISIGGARPHDLSS